MMKSLKDLKAALLTPSSPVEEKEFEKTLEVVKDLFSQVYLPKYLNRRRSYMAGTGEERKADFLEAAGTDADVLLCLRGGYASSQMVALLPGDFFTEKVLIGYSDVTNLHLYLNNRGIPTIHGPMGYSNMREKWGEYSQRSLEQALFTKGRYKFSNAPKREMEVLVPGEGEGMLIGGNLSLVGESLGTFLEPDFRGKLLFLEEVDEPVPAIDRKMTQLKLAGVFQKVEGVVLGDFTNAKNRYDEDYTVDVFFQEFFRDYEKPVLSHITSGHGPVMGSLVFGKRGRVKQGELYLEGLGR